MQRTIAYVDGFNLYYGLRSKHWQRFYWLNLRELVLLMLKPQQELASINYFTSVVSYPDDKHKRQRVFLDALSTLPDLAIHYGHFLSNDVICRNCGHTYVTHHEKMTDVNIAVELLSDAFQDRYDVAMLISADSDLVGPIKTVRRLFPQKRIVVVFPPDRHSSALKVNAHACLHITPNLLSRSQFPDHVISADGVSLWRPSEWR